MGDKGNSGSTFDLWRLTSPMNWGCVAHEPRWPDSRIRIHANLETWQRSACGRLTVMLVTRQGDLRGQRGIETPTSPPHSSSNSQQTRQLPPASVPNQSTWPATARAPASKCTTLLRTLLGATLMPPVPIATAPLRRPAPAPRAPASARAAPTRSKPARYASTHRYISPEC